MDTLDDAYKQFEGMKVPGDIKPKVKFSRKSLQEEVNERRKENKVKQKVDISKDLRINLNSSQFRPNEVHIHTCDIGANYVPDFDFSDLDEFDAWRKTCKLKYELQRFDDCKVNLVRSEGFFHKMQVCESLTLFEETHRMLRPGGMFLISVLNIFKIVKFISDLNPGDMHRLYHYERLLYSGTDSTGMYYNRTIWTFERFKTYLGMSNFRGIEINKKEEKPYKLSIKAWK